MKPTSLIQRLRRAQEFEDEQTKQRMKIVATETQVKIEQGSLDSEAHIGAEAFSTSQNVNDGEQMGILLKGKGTSERSRMFRKLSRFLSSHRIDLLSLTSPVAGWKI